MDGGFKVSPAKLMVQIVRSSGLTGSGLGRVRCLVPNLEVQTDDAALQLQYSVTNK